MVDADGKVTLSNVVKLNAFASGFTLGNVYPSPAKNNVKVEWDAKQSGSTTLSITDVNGHVLRNMQLQSVTGFNSINIDIHQLPAGQYFLQITKQHEKLQTAITKL